MSSPSPMAPVIARSSLEILLDSIRQRDERPSDLPPALPVRPTSRGRPPSPRKSVPVNFNTESSEPRRLEDKEEELMLRSDIDVVIKTSVFGSKRVATVKQVEKSSSTMITEPVSYEKDVQVPDVSDLSVVLSPSAVEPGKKPDYGGSINYATSEVARFEDARNQTLWGILWVQKNFRCVRARSHYQQLKVAAANLQSFVRGEKARHCFQVSLMRWRAATVIQKHARQWFARTFFDEQQKAITLLQSVIRGWLARKHLVLRKMDESIVNHSGVRKRETSKVIQTKLTQRPAKNPPEFVKDANNGHRQIHNSDLAELQSQVLTTEAALREKEEENAILKLRLQDCETRWLNYELRMKSMEETWQKQLTSLQMNLAAARKNHAPEEITKQPGKLEISKVSHYYTSQDVISAESEALEDTLTKLPNGSDATPTRNNDSTCSSVIQLMDEFDQQRHKFNKDAGLLTEIKSEKYGTKINPYEELQKLKAHFGSWKKDYKMRLKHAKTELLKHGNHDEKSRKKWWCAVSSR